MTMARHKPIMTAEIKILLFNTAYLRYLTYLGRFSLAGSAKRPA
jgi:hypothetical protein